jgi:hypothetical protein
MRNNGVEIRKLMGFNGMYNNPTPDQYCRRLVQLAANPTGLEVVSPTLNAKQSAVTWFADFLKECYDKRNDSLYPCDIELSTMFAIHQYDWRDSPRLLWRK